MTVTISNVLLILAIIIIAQKMYYTHKKLSKNMKRMMDEFEKSINKVVVIKRA